METRLGLWSGRVTVADTAVEAPDPVCATLGHCIKSRAESEMVPDRSATLYDVQIAGPPLDSRSPTVTLIGR